MNLTLFNRAMRSIVAFFVVFSAISCVQEEYEISEDNLNLEVTVFQEGVQIPLGSTEAIKVSQLLDELDPEIKDMFPVGTDSAYAFSMAETIPLSDKLDFLAESFSIDGYSPDTEKIPFDLSDVNVSDVNVPQMEIPYEKKLSEVIPSVDLNFSPSGLSPVEETADLSGYETSVDLDVEDKTVDGVIAEIDDVSMLPLTNQYIAPYVDTELPLSSSDPSALTISSLLKLANKPEFKIETIENIEINDKITVPVSFTLPKEITGVNSVSFGPDTKIRITLDLSDNMFFTSGRIIPHLDLDIHEIFHLTDEENNSHEHPGSPLEDDHIIDDFILTGDTDNKYYASNTYGVKSLAVHENDFTKDQNGCLVFNRPLNIIPVITLRYEDLKTSFRAMSQHDGKPVTMTLKVEFLNFVVDNVEVDVEPVVTEIATEFDLDFSQSLPDLVEGVQEVYFAEGSGLNLDIDVSNVNRISGLDLAVESLDLVFPEGIKVQGADADNHVSLPIGSLADGKTTKKVVVTGIEFDPALQKPGEVSFNGKVKVEAKAVVSVKDGQYINTKDLPKTAAEDVVISVTPSASFEVDDFKVDFDGYYYEIDEEETIEFEVSKEVAELGKVVIIPETEDGRVPVITIDIVLPDSQLPIGPSEDGLVIDFPDMIFFKNIPDEIKPYYNNGKLTFTNKLPSRIELTVDYIEAEAVKTEKDGKEVYMISDVFSVSGAVGVAPGVIVKADVDALTDPDAMVSFNAFVPKMVPSTVNIDMYQVDIPEKTIEFGDAISLSSLPEELVAVGDILLKDVALTVDVKAPGISDLVKDADVTLDMDLVLPEVIMLDTPLENGVLEVKGKLVGDEIEIDPVNILGLRLNKSASELTEYLKTMKVAYGGSVTIKDAELDMSAFKDITLDVDISLMTAGSENKIEISKVTGKVDYAVEPISVDVDLSSLTSSLETEGLNATLDFNRFSLALEVKTNLSIPLVADLVITPFKGDVAGTPLTLPEPLKIEMPEASAEPSLIRFWVSNFDKGTDPYMPEGYEHVSLDILELIADLPDRLVLSLEAGTDAGSEASIAPSAEGYVLEAAYAFSLPFEFGEKMALEFTTTIEDLPEVLGTVLQYGSLGLTGEIENSLPLSLEMTYNFLDSKGTKIDLVENAGKQIIKPGTLTGETVKTDLNIIVGVKKGADVSDINAIELVFKANSVAGAPIKSDSFIKASLQALVPEGITLDLKDLMSNEENEGE